MSDEIGQAALKTHYQGQIKVAYDVRNDTSPVATLSVHKPAEFFSSPRGKILPESGLFVIQFRDGATGQVLSQYPSEKLVAEYQKTAELSEEGSPPESSVVVQATKSENENNSERGIMPLNVGPSKLPSTEG